MKNLFKKIAEFQQEVPVIHKGTQGYGYSYADLPTIFEKINPLMKKHGLGFTQLLSGSAIKTIIFDVESGESLESIADIPQGVNLKGMNDFQVLGSAITYIRRYALSAAMGLVTDKDTDAAGEQDKKEAPVKKEIVLPKLTKDNPKWQTIKEFCQSKGEAEKWGFADVEKKFYLSTEIKEALKNDKN